MITGDALREARGRARLSQEALGKLIGVSMRTVGNWERGSVVMPGATEARVRDVLGEHLSDQARSNDKPAPALDGASDAELLAEIARRFERGRGASTASEGRRLRPVAREIDDQ